MAITIKNLKLVNFKCFRQKEFTFNQHVTTILGRNGVGKTTIADAILFCLFGKNTTGQSDLELFKTRENGHVIPNLDHSVEMELDVCLNTPADIEHGRIVTLKRSIKEVWIKKRSSEETVFKNNTCEYFVNGEAYTQADYRKFIDTLISEDVFRAITNPTYFLSLKWQVQRDFLAHMVGNIAPEEIATTTELADLVKSLSDTPEGIDIISYRKHLSYQIKQIKDKLEKIPVRLEEQNKALPEKLDWSALEVQYTDVLRQSQEITEKIIAIKSGNGSDVLREEIRKRIRFISSCMDDIENDQRKLLRIRQDEHDKAVNEARQQFNQLVTTQRDLEASIPSFDTLAQRCRETAEETFKKEQAYIRSEWTKTQADFRQSDETRCPVCGQTFPPDMLAEKESLFNQNKARLKAELTERANKAKQLLSDAETEAKDFEAQKEEKEKQLADIKEKINTAFAQKQKLEKMTLPTLDEMLADTSDYQRLIASKADEEKKLDSVALTQEDNTQLADLEAKKVQYADELQRLNTQLATKTQYERIQKLITAINEEKQSLVEQLSELERKEDIACQYQERQNAILEERVNQHFSIVRWKMFRTVNNGGDSFQEPYCECLVDGIPYGGGLNQAARLNAGLDVINTMCRHYNVSAPIVIDNSESTLNIIPTTGQQIRLQVADTDLQTV